MNNIWGKIEIKVNEHSYMSGIDRGKCRVGKTGEVFTPTHTVIKMLQKSVNLKPDTFLPNKKIIDVCCGDGQFLVSVFWYKIFKYGISKKMSLNDIYGVDLMQDNVDLCRERLLCGREDLRYIVENNIVCADALRYHYRFDGTPPYDQSPDLLSFF